MTSAPTPATAGGGTEPTRASRAALPGGAVPDLGATTVTQAPGPGRRPRRLTPRSVVLLVFGVLIAVVYLLPFYVAIVNAFKTDQDASLHPLALPVTWTGAAFQTLFENSDFGIWAMNSIIVAVFVTLGRIFFDSLAGYALARLRFPGRQTVFALLIAVMAVPGVVLLIPKFLVINQLGMYDSYSGMIVPLLVDAAGVFIMKNFFESIPVSVEEQAKIDGAGTFRTFWSVVLPMARPAVVTITVLSFQGSWNELAHFIVSTSSPDLTTLTKGVASLASGALSAGNQFPVKLAAAFVMTIPVAVAFFVFQKRIMNGSDGAVKE
ncbi:carbohydrate ABC transporter permease [Curtobacterium sp. SORGH_AS_0776]|uniref:carbohydrate ABC transporter permease n=1 Tax=Curtobacterium sp. SORGH_AS_0776 TaxID=3041798 RepID=UPI002861577E|nr:carbohydrate ABC transporter permease [Curtobacterium sp. SORGH_AS_0776]MDR6170041.1 multiple sugar transport system permease protein [Curtobacterium sp. SORGH_AS_0776]